MPNTIGCTPNFIENNYSGTKMFVCLRYIALKISFPNSTVTDFKSFADSIFTCIYRTSSSLVQCKGQPWEERIWLFNHWWVNDWLHVVWLPTEVPLGKCKVKDKMYTTTNVMNVGVTTTQWQTGSSLNWHTVRSMTDKGSWVSFRWRLHVYVFGQKRILFSPF